MSVSVRTTFPRGRLKRVSRRVVRVCGHLHRAGRTLCVRHRGLVARLRASHRKLNMFGESGGRVLMGGLFARCNGLVSSSGLRTARRVFSVYRFRGVASFVGGTRGHPSCGRRQEVSMRVGGGKHAFVIRYVVFRSLDFRVSVGSVARRRRRMQLGQRLARGVTRRLGAPMDDVRNCLRAVIGGRGVTPRGVRIFLRHYCTRDGHLDHLLHSVSMLAHVSRTTGVVSVRGISVDVLISGVIGRISLRLRRGRVAIIGSLGPGVRLQNGCSLLCSVFHGLVSGTVTCTNAGVRVGVDYFHRSRGCCCFDFTSANVNISPRRLGHLFRHFCHMSGKHSHGLNNANLKLTVIGGTILVRKNAVSTGGGRNKKLRFMFALTGREWRPILPRRAGYFTCLQEEFL